MRKMTAADDIFTVGDVLTAQECADLIALSERIGFADAPITTYGGFVMRPDMRNNTRVMVDDLNLASALWRKVEQFIEPEFKGKKVLGLNERFRFYRYDPGQKFSLHFDGCYRRPNGEESLLTLMIYLNEGFIGGDTYFPDQETSILPQTGLALFFRHQLLHEGAVVLRGRKYVLRSDVMFEP